MPIKNLIYRLVKGAPLTASENDGNFTAISNAFLGIEQRLSRLSDRVASAVAPTDTTKIWDRISDYGVIEGTYRFISGQWRRPHPLAPSTEWLMVYTGNASSIDALDGGAAGSISDAAGPFWAISSVMAGKMPLGVGVLPSGLSVTIGLTGGEEKNLLTIENTPAHVHHLTGATKYNISLSDIGGTVLGGNSAWSVGTAITDTESAGGGLSHNNMPPYSGVYYIKRTARKDHVAT